MQRFGRIMVAAGALATLALVATAVTGYRGALSDAGLRLHVLLGLGALLVYTLSHLWVLFYLSGAVRVLRRAAGADGADALDAELVGFRRRTLPALLVALALPLVVFVLGTGVYSGWCPVGYHAAAFYLTVAAEVWAAGREWKAFGGAERSLRRLGAQA